MIARRKSSRGVARHSTRNPEKVGIARRLLPLLLITWVGTSVACEPEREGFAGIVEPQLDRWNADVIGRVTDLSVFAVTDTSATLTFTEVSDARGRAPQYEVRYAPAPINWSTATRTARGTCAYPIVGVQPGAALRCDVRGLATGTLYDFQLVAFDTNGGRSVYGALSNIASGETAPGSAIVEPGVASVSVAPASLSFSALGQSAPLQAVALDAAGNAVGSASLLWSSLSTAIATVDTTGLVTARSNGTTFVVVTSACCAAADTVRVTVKQVADSVVISPRSLQVEPGATARMSASALDANGHPMTGVAFAWSSSTSSVASVDSTGNVRGMSEGVATVTAATTSASSGAPVTVADTTASTPANVTDLSVIAVTDSSATLHWTQVDDGTGAAASYALRYGTPAVDWGSAYGTEVRVSGTSVGATRQYTFTGLTQGTAYEFQLVAYRGTLGVDAVFGSLSNKASGTTGAAPTTQQAAVTLTPASVSFTSLNGSQQLTAVAVDGSGAAVANPGFTWRSTNTLVATVNTTGLVTARAVGAAAIIVTAACCGSDTASVVVSQTVSSVSISPAQSSIGVGQTQQFSATVSDANGFPVPGATVNWASTAASVATVDGRGLATGLAAGSTTIRATAGGVVGSASLSVGSPASSGNEEPRPGANSVLLVNDNFDSYADFTDARRSGDYQVSTLTNEIASLVSPGSGGSGKAIRLVWPVSTIEQYAPISKTISGWPAARTAEYFSIEYRAPGFVYSYDVNLGSPRLGKKHFLIFPADNQQRITNSHSNDLGIGVSLLQSNGVKIGDGDEYDWNYPGGSLAATVATITDGNWHRYTYRRLPESQPGAMDGSFTVWFDGQLVWHMDRIGTGTAKAGSIAMASTFNGGSSRIQSEYFDNLRIWYER